MDVLTRVGQITLESTDFCNELEFCDAESDTRIWIVGYEFGVLGACFEEYPSFSEQDAIDAIADSGKLDCLLMSEEDREEYEDSILYAGNASEAFHSENFWIVEIRLQEVAELFPSLKVAITEYPVSKTFNTITEESAQEGDFAESGFVFKDVLHTGAECVRLLECCSELSSSYVTPDSCGRVWTNEDYEVNYQTGEETQYSFHIDAPSRELYEIYLQAGLIKA